jgi:hypothetical protein
MTTHPTQGDAASRSKLFWLGWALTALVGLFLLFGAINSILLTETATAGLAEMEYPASAARPIGVVLLVSVVLYLIPNTTVLGAILLTGYLGGAVATHVRAADPLTYVLFPAVFGAIVWLGIFFRDARVRAIVPWRA